MVNFPSRAGELLLSSLDANLIAHPGQMAGIAHRLSCS